MENQTLVKWIDPAFDFFHLNNTMENSTESNGNGAVKWLDAIDQFVDVSGRAADVFWRFQQNPNVPGSPPPNGFQPGMAGAGGSISPMFLVGGVALLGVVVYAATKK